MTWAGTSGNSIAATTMDAAGMNGAAAITSAVKAACTHPTAMEAAAAPAEAAPASAAASESIVGNETGSDKNEDGKSRKKITKHGISSLVRGAVIRSSVMPRDCDWHPTTTSSALLIQA
ncbi:hypothetical protein GCM10007857_12240 [Bradyrhizobium iriomotense]|uniref:Uncharacterized protein n=1 Tax=Bradyrhizobium iriomotense TaxID=441950 RepID=A0ABQ6AU68_9BRAD|nr:hypothetical protein GCM10007857_12240 [Bradyrhizobium iriomotense]